MILEPARNIVPNLVYAQTGSGVRLSMVAGEPIYRDGSFTRIDADSISLQVAGAIERFQADITGDPVVANLPIVELTQHGFH